MFQKRLKSGLRSNNNNLLVCSVTVARTVMFIKSSTCCSYRSSKIFSSSRSVLKKRQHMCFSRAQVFQSRVFDCVIMQSSLKNLNITVHKECRSSDSSQILVIDCNLSAFLTLDQGKKSSIVMASLRNPCFVQFSS